MSVGERLQTEIDNLFPAMTAGSLDEESFEFELEQDLAIYYEWLAKQPRSQWHVGRRKMNLFRHHMSLLYG